MVWLLAMLPRTSGVRNDRQQEMRWMPGLVIDPVQHGLAAADVIRDVLDVGGTADAGRDVEAGDLDADAVTLLELVGGRHDLDGVFIDLTGNDGLAGRAGGCHGRPGIDRVGSTARWDALSQPRVSSRSCRPSVMSRSPSRAVCTPTSGPTSLRMTIQLVSS